LPRKYGFEKQLFGLEKRDSGDSAVIKSGPFNNLPFGKMAHDKRTEDGAETRKCAKCESQKLRLILRFLDPRTGNHVRLYKCECGERVWEEE